MIENIEEICVNCKSRMSSGQTFICVCGKIIHQCSFNIKHECTNRDVVIIDTFITRHVMSVDYDRNESRVIDGKTESNFIKVVGSNWDEKDTLEYFERKYEWFHKPQAEEDIKNLFLHSGQDMKNFENLYMARIYKSMYEFEGIFKSENKKVCVVLDIPFFKWSIRPKNGQKQIVIPNECEYILVLTTSKSTCQALTLNMVDQNESLRCHRLTNQIIKEEHSFTWFSTSGMCLTLMSTYGLFGFKSIKKYDEVIKK